MDEKRKKKNVNVMLISIVENLILKNFRRAY